MHRGCKTIGLLIIALGLGIILALTVPLCVLVVIEGIILVCIGWSMLRG